MNQLSPQTSSPIISQAPKSLQTPQQRISRIKKTKNIRKQRIQKKKDATCSEQSESYQKQKDKISREKKIELQKQKNRIAAQLSRDRQKKYVQELETKIIQLETEIQKQLCSKCRSPILHESSTDQSNSKENCSLPVENMEEEQIQNSHANQSFANFYREQSSVSYNSISKFLFVFMITVALASMSFSIDSPGKNVQILPGRVLQAIAPTDSLLKQHKNIKQNDSQTLRNSLIQYRQQNNLKLATENDCKYDYIQSYFLDEEEIELRGGYQYSHYDHDRLLNCVRPQLIMKKNIDKQQENDGFFSGLFTVVLDNPEILEVVSHKGVMYLDNVVSLRGLYEIQVKFMNIKKIIGQNCLN